MSIVGVKNPKKKTIATKKATENFSVAFLWDSHGQYTYFGHKK